MTITLGQSSANQSAVTFAGKGKHNKGKKVQGIKVPLHLAQTLSGPELDQYIDQQKLKQQAGKQKQKQTGGATSGDDKSGLAPKKKSGTDGPKAQKQQQKAKAKEKLVSEDELTDEELQTDGEVNTDDELDGVDETQEKDSAKDVTANKKDTSNTAQKQEEESTGLLGTIFNVITAPIRWVYSAVTGILSWISGLFSGGEK